MKPYTKATPKWKQKKAPEPGFFFAYSVRFLLSRWRADLTGPDSIPCCLLNLLVAACLCSITKHCQTNKDRFSLRVRMGKDYNVKRSDEIQTELQRLEQELAPLDQELEGHIWKFATEAVPSAAATWMRSEVKRQVESNAARIDEIGTEKLKELKVELAELIEQLPQLALAAIADQKKWPHSEKVDTRTLNYSNPQTSYFDDVFRMVINNLGALLVKYDLVKVPSSRSPEWEKDRGGSYRYAFNPGFNERDFPAIQEYKTVRKVQRQKAADLVRKREELVKAKAAELWDSV